MFHYTEHIMDFESTSRQVIERIVIKKSFLLEFEPSKGEFLYSRGKIKIRNVEKV
ncbi:hypothetical protein [Thermococcus pacificus]|uniref:hypothetical protein n=1 Tax=Thermococcus pacificus TaxID=71998 RepID=UPI0012FD028F|nr:hypothetical protein [Thermococcus pacificus]